MSIVGHARLSVPIGALLACLFALGLLSTMGSFAVREGVVATSINGRIMALPLAGFAVALAAWGAAVSAAVVGVLPWPRVSAGLLVTTAFLGVVVSAWYLGRAAGLCRGDARFLRHRGAWVVLLTTAIQLPLLGSFSLIDPWETHYGEVAREMLARDDWISLWWAQDGWFWSKPVLNFWAQALSFSTFGVGFVPDAMLRGAESGLLPQPEWAVRMPGFLTTLGAAYALYKAVAVTWGERAGWIGALVLATTPYWVLLARQSMADMPYVAMQSIAMALFLIGIAVPANRLVKVHGICLGGRRFAWTVREVVMASVVIVVGAQVALLLSQHVTLDLSGGSRWLSLHGDEFFAGSGMGNCGIVGNRACSRHGPTYPAWQPYRAALLWAATCAGFLWLSRGEHRLRRIAFLGGWFFVALSFMAKGAPGLILPLFTIAVFAAATRRWRLLRDAEPHSFVLLFACVALPWFVQMYARHGAGFVDRLFFHDMYKRAFVHVHDTNVGDDVSFGYYIWQLGYGLFPWSGLCGAAVLWWLREERVAPARQRHSAALLGLWFTGAFAMFTLSLTKFHHYILPAVPPIAMLTGIMLDRMVPSRDEAPSGRSILQVGALGFIVVGLWVGVAGLVAARLPRVASAAPGGVGLWLGVACTSLAVLASVVLWRQLGGHETCSRGSSRALSAIEGSVVLLAGVVLSLVGRDLLRVTTGQVSGQARLLHLFTYNYERLWPSTLSFRAELFAFVTLAIVSSAMWLRRSQRRFAYHALGTVAVLFGLWMANVYLVRLAPHWGQRETTLAYYGARASPRERLVAYQMNWKGENFYTGNRLPVFVASGQEFEDWIVKQRAGGRSTMFFVTEHGRVDSLRDELGHPRHFERLTTAVINNKFVLVKVGFE